MPSHEATILEIINTLTPILCRPGGKKLLKKRIVKEMPPHTTYVEPFFGTGAVFFEKPLADKNILGDNDRELMDFYKNSQKKDKLTCDIRRNPSKWNRLKNKKNKSPCDYVYLVKGSFACAGNQSRTISDQGGSNSIQNYDKQIQKLQKAKLVTADFNKTIRQNDSINALFYLDPPYHETDCSYPDGSCDVTPQDVKKAVDGIKGNFILSYNNHPEVRKMFCKDYKCIKIKTKYMANTLANSNKTENKELLIKNF